MKIPVYFAFQKRPWENPWLDMLRACAILLVMISHVFFSDSIKGFWGYFTRNGLIGVDLFFVLSGYLITKNLVKEKENPLLLSRYFIKRAFRILPCYFFILALVIFGFFPYFARDETPFFLMIFYHVLMLQDYFFDTIPVLWSIGVEEKFYILIPFIFLVITKTRPALAILSLLSIASISPLIKAVNYISLDSFMSVEHYWVYMNKFRHPFHLNLTPLCFGILVALFVHYYKKPLFKKTRAKTYLAGLFVMYPFLVGTYDFNNRPPLFLYKAAFCWSVMALLFALMVLCTVVLKKERMPGEMFFRIVARLSYTLYLVHLPFRNISWEITSNITDQHTSYYFKAIYLFLYFGLSLISSLALHYSIEKPFMKLRERILKQ